MKLVPLEGAFIAALALIAGVPASATDWQRTGFEDVWVAFGQTVGDPSSVETGMVWNGLRLSGHTTRMSLVEVSRFLDDELSNEASTGLKAEDGKISSIRYSLEEVWSVVSEDPSVVAVIPVGYLERGGVPQIAGKIRIQGEDRNPLMHAPTLTTFFCVDNVMRASRRGSSTQWPYTFLVNYNPELKYQYAESETDVVFDQEGLSETDQKAEFAACPDMVQLGPRILEPRKRPGATGLKDRRSEDIFLNDSLWQHRATRTVMVYDLSGNMTFMVSRGPSLLSYFADVAEQADFYQRRVSACAFQEKRFGGDGELRDDGTRAVRSKACEYWAVALTSFEHSGMMLRSSPGGTPLKIGNVERTIPAALVIRFSGTQE